MIRGIKPTMADNFNPPNCLSPGDAKTPVVGVLDRDRISVLPRPEGPIEEMFLHVGGNAYQIASLEQASQMFCIARDKHGEGASKTPTPLITDAAGQVIAHVSYNGRVWPSTAWTVDATPLYDNRMP